MVRYRMHPKGYNVDVHKYFSTTSPKVYTDYEDSPIEWMETETHESALCSVGTLIQKTSGTPLLSTASENMSVLSGKSSLDITDFAGVWRVTVVPLHCQSPRHLRDFPCTYASIVNLDISETPVLGLASS